MQIVSLETLQGLKGRLVGLGLLHSLWISLAVASLVALLFQSRPRLSHQARYLILLAALCLVVIGPIVAVPLHYAAASSARTAEDSAEPIVVAAAVSSTVERPSDVGHPPVRSAEGLSSFRSHLIPFVTIAFSQTLVATRHYQPALVALWLVGIVVLTSILVLGARAVQKTCREARPADAAIQGIVDELARRAASKSPPRVLVHPSVIEPHLCGLFRPVILLPKRWLSCGDRNLVEAILAHELAHARRLDHLVNLVQRLVEVFLFYSPAAHWLSRSLRRHREFCADALAVRLTRDPLALAQALESLARFRFTYPGSLAVGSSLGGQTVKLLPRIQELLGMMPSRPRTNLWPFAALISAGIVALIALAFGLSQDLSSPPGRTARSDIDPDTAIEVPYSAYSGRQISFEVRLIDLDTGVWHDFSGDRLKLMQREADGSAWLADQEGLSELLKRAGQKNAANILQAPKVTVFEDQSAIIFTNAQYYLATLEKAKASQAPAMRKALKARTTQPSGAPAPRSEAGSIVYVKGSISYGAFRLSADLRDSCPASLETPRHDASLSDMSSGGRALVPATVERHCDVTCDVPDGSSLVVMFGSSKDEVSGIRTVAGDPESSGSFVREVKSVTRERLVLITPRAILLEDEKRASAIKGFFDGVPQTR